MIVKGVSKVNVYKLSLSNAYRNTIRYPVPKFVSWGHGDL